MGRKDIAHSLDCSITASSEVSRVEVDGVSDSLIAHVHASSRLQPEFDSRIQGGVLADGIAGFLSGLFTVTPMRWVGLASTSASLPSFTSSHPLVPFLRRPCRSSPVALPALLLSPPPLADPLQHLRAEQRCHRAHALREPQSRLRLRELPHPLRR